MRLPTKPTSKTWNQDARALLEMGASSIDANTLRGVISELDKLRTAVKEKIQEIYENTACSEADDNLIRVLCEIDGEVCE
jgi:hypothetical protein